MAKNKGLGRGYDAIFEDNFREEAAPAGGKTTIPVTLIDTNPNQPRKTFDKNSLAELADSINQNGLLQPILVRETGDMMNRRYEIIAGERRFRACKMIGMSEIPAIVTEADDLSSAKYALIENLQREELNSVEEAMAYKSLIDDFDLTQEEIASQVGKSRSAVANSLRILELPNEVLMFIESGAITGGHARALLALKDKDKNKIIEIAANCGLNGWSVRMLEDYVKKLNFREDNEKIKKAMKEAPVKVNYMKVIEERFTGITGRRCRISSSKGVKTFQLEYRDNRDLETILKLLAGDKIFEDL